MGSKPGKLVPHKPRQYERNGGRREETEGLGQDCNGGRLIRLERYRRYRVRYHLWREAWNQRDWKQYYPFSQTPKSSAYKDHGVWALNSFLWNVKKWWTLYLGCSMSWTRGSGDEVSWEITRVGTEERQVDFSSSLSFNFLHWWSIYLSYIGPSLYIQL